MAYGRRRVTARRNTRAVRPRRIAKSYRKMGVPRRMKRRVTRVKRRAPRKSSSTFLSRLRNSFTAKNLGYLVGGALVAGGANAAARYNQGDNYTIPNARKDAARRARGARFAEGLGNLRKGVSNFYSNPGGVYRDTVRGWEQKLGFGANAVNQPDNDEDEWYNARSNFTSRRPSSNYEDARSRFSSRRGSSDTDYIPYQSSPRVRRRSSVEAMQYAI
nr:MAG: hypothetical protein [Arizlama virus]